MYQDRWKISVTTVFGLFFLTLCLFPSQIDISRIAVGMLILAGIYTGVLDKKFFQDPVLIGIIAYMAVAVFSNIFGDGDISKSFGILSWILPFLLGKIFSETHPDKIMNSLFCGSIFLGTYMLCALAFIFLEKNGLSYFSIHNLKLTFRNETRTALFVAIAAFISLFYTLKFSKTTYRRLLSSSIFAILLFALIVSGKRATLAAFLIISIGLLINQKNIRTIIIIFIATAVYIVISGQSQRFDLSPDRLLSSQGVVERQTVWHAAYNIFSANPLLGSGFSSFKKESKPYVEKYREKLHEKYEYENLEDAHNIIINIAAETGIMGLITIILIFGAPCRHLIKIHKNNKTAQCLFSCILIIIIHLQLHAHLFSTNISSLVFLLFGLSMGTHDIKEKN